MNRCSVQKSKTGMFKVQFNNLTLGELYALSNALRVARSMSAVARDLSACLRNAFVDLMPVSPSTAKDLLRNLNDEPARGNNE